MPLGAALGGRAKPDKDNLALVHVCINAAVDLEHTHHPSVTESGYPLLEQGALSERHVPS